MSLRSIQFALLGNAIFSILSGAILVLFSSWLNHVMHISQSQILPALGIALLLFGMSLVWLARRRMIPRKAVIVVISLDAVWVIGSWWIFLSGAFGLSQTGYELIIVVAVIVAGFGCWQWWYLSETE